MSRGQASSDRGRAYFAARAGGYDRGSSRGLWSRLRALESPVVMALAGVQRGERVLDAGCGAGHYTRLLMEAGAEVDALDALPEMLAEVRARLGVRTIEGDIAAVALAPIYDKIVCAGVLEFVPDRAAALVNLARGLRTDGAREITLLILARCWPGFGYWLARRVNGIRMPMYSRGGLDALAASAGLRVVEARRAGYNWVARLTPTCPS